MRCREARAQIEQMMQDSNGGKVEEGLAQHLETCESCRREAQAVRTLNIALESGRSDDELDMRPLESQRKLVESRLARGEVPKVYSRRPRLRLALSSALVTLVLALALVPFSWQETVGYNLSLSGVDEEIACSDEMMCDLLYSLGLYEADIDPLCCDASTCGVVVLDLKTEEEAGMVLAAVQRLEKSGLKADLIPITASSSETILDRANDRLLGKN